MISIHQKACVPKAVIVGSLLLGATMPILQAQSVPPRAAEARTQAYPDIAGLSEDQARLRIRNKLTGILVPKVEFRSTTLSSVLEYFRQESARLDPEPEPQLRGVNLILRLPAVSPAAPASGTGAGIGGGDAPVAAMPSANTRITLSLSRIPLLEALQYVASQAGLKLKIEPYAVSFVPLTENTDVMVTRVFRVPPHLIGNLTDGNLGGTLLDQPATAAH